MLLLVPAHRGCPGQSPESRKMVVCACVRVCVCECVMHLFKLCFKPSANRLK